MARETEVRVTIDEQLEREAAAVYAKSGLTTSEAVRLFLVKTVKEHAFPFEPLVPNAETIDAMTAARNGECVRVGSIADLMADLHADD